MKESWLERHEPVLDGLAALLGPLVEIVAHDVERDEVVSIWNPTATRKVGDPSRLGSSAEEFSIEEPYVGPYSKTGDRGETMSSVSISVGNGAGLICINFDRSPLLAAAEALTFVAHPHVAQPASLFDEDWKNRIATTVGDWCRSNRLRSDTLRADQRRELVGFLQAQGLFETRRAADHTAQALGVSRATIYNDLKERT